MALCVQQHAACCCMVRSTQTRPTALNIGAPGSSSPSPKLMIVMQISTDCCAGIAAHLVGEERLAEEVALSV